MCVFFVFFYKKMKNTHMYMHNVWQPLAAKHCVYMRAAPLFSLLLVFFSHSLGYFLPIFVVCNRDVHNAYFTPLNQYCVSPLFPGSERSQRKL